ncbi:MAG: septal ring lytic transglycosylase RlpA family protein [Halioglobus sp.]|nr:septal ring lytic transglycosylase RlpA family protein [Halioglobus sp.]
MTRLFALIVLGLALAACSLTTEDSRYSRSQDAAPPRTIHADDVRDAVPRPDPVLAAGNKSPYTVNGRTFEVLADHSGYREEGTASWYGLKFHGHETSNGEIFDLYRPSAAHKTLPIPCYARVTNLQNGRSVVVRVNDRGPFHSDRLIDLSYAAAIKLGFMEQGTAPVRVEVIDVVGADDRRDNPLGSYRYLQVGAFASQNSAQRLRGELQALLAAPVSVSEVDAGGDRLYRVRVGPVEDSEKLQSLQQTLQSNGYSGGQPLP